MKYEIIVGSVLGATEYVAEAVKARLEEGDHQANIHFQPNFSDISQQAIWIICTSTHGAGDLPDNIQTFADQLKNKNLQNINYLIIGLGDSSYDTYCYGAIEMEKRMDEANAKQLAEPVHIDVLNHPIPEDTALEWLSNWLT